MRPPTEPNDGSELPISLKKHHERLGNKCVRLWSCQSGRSVASGEEGTQYTYERHCGDSGVCEKRLFRRSTKKRDPDFDLVKFLKGWRFGFLRVHLSENEEGIGDSAVVDVGRCARGWRTQGRYAL